MTTTITIIPNEKSYPAGKLADAELHFTDGLLAGLKLIGFAVWEARGGRRNVTVPSRTYAVNGERRSFALLRAVEDASAQEQVRLAVLAAYDAYEYDGARNQAPITPSAVEAAASYIATPSGPVSDRSLGTAADYGTRGDAPEQTDWTF